MRIVLLRIDDGFADQTGGGEMDHSGGLVVRDGSVLTCTIAHVSNDQRPPFDEFSVARAEIVKCYWHEAGIRQGVAAMGSDVSGTAGDENRQFHDQIFARLAQPCPCLSKANMADRGAFLEVILRSRNALFEALPYVRCSELPRWLGK